MSDADYGGEGDMTEMMSEEEDEDEVARNNARIAATFIGIIAPVAERDVPGVGDRDKGEVRSEGEVKRIGEDVRVILERLAMGEEGVRDIAAMKGLLAEWTAKVETIIDKNEHNAFNVSVLAKEIVKAIKENKTGIGMLQVDNQKMMEGVSEHLKLVSTEVDARIGKVIEGNDLLAKAMAVEVVKMNEANQKVLFGLGVEAAKVLQEEMEKGLTKFKGDLDQVAVRHEKVVSIAEFMQWGLWVWRWAVFVMLAEMVQGWYQVNGVWSWVKVFSGLALF